jgi:tetratricopeptide (TPR) repeat protein
VLLATAEIALVTAVAVVSNAASGVIPRAWRPYAWVSWPLLGGLTLIMVATAMRGGYRERPVGHLGGPDPAGTGRDVHTIDRMVARASGRPVTAPRQLPPAPAHFAARTAELAALDALLRGGGDSQPVVISAIDGAAGVGKTTLAVRWAHRVAAQFPDGQLYIDLRGFDPDYPPMDADRVITVFLDALTEPGTGLPEDPHARAGLYRSLVAGRRMLILLDNASHARQVRPLLPGGGRSLVLVTSRNQLSGLVVRDGAHPLTVPLLDPDEARQVLVARLGAERVAASLQTVDRIIASCAGLPLALAIVAARAELEGSLERVAAQLREERYRLDGLTTHDDPHTDLRAVLSWSYRSLSQPAAHLFRLLGTHPGPEISMPAAASIAGLPPDQTIAALAELIHTHLLSEPAERRYVLHDVVRAFAAEQARGECSEDEQRAATARMIDHYVWTAHTGTRLLDPSRDPILTGPPAAGVQPHPLAGPDQATQWFTVERQVLTRVVDRAYQAALDDRTWQLAWGMLTFLDRRGRWDEFVAVQQIAVQATQRLDDPVSQARAQRLLSVGYERLGQFELERTHLRLADDLYRRADDRTGQAHIQQQLSVIADRDGAHADSVAYARRALELYEAIGDQRGEALVLNLIGWGLTHLNENQQAIAYCRQALELYHTVDNPDGEAETWDTLGLAYHRLGDHAAAIEAYGHAQQLFHDIDDRYLEATTLVRIGDVEQDAAPTARAAARVAGATWRHALEILTDLGHSGADQLRTRITALDAAADEDTP